MNIFCPKPRFRAARRHPLVQQQVSRCQGRIEEFGLHLGLQEIQNIYERVSFVSFLIETRSLILPENDHFFLEDIWNLNYEFFSLSLELLKEGLAKMRVTYEFNTEQMTEK